MDDLRRMLLRRGVWLYGGCHVLLLYEVRMCVVAVKCVFLVVIVVVFRFLKERMVFREKMEGINES